MVDELTDSTEDKRTTASDESENQTTYMGCCKSKALVNDWISKVENDSPAILVDPKGDRET